MSWPRTEVGTLQCPCGKAGKIFTQFSTEEKDGKKYGLFGGYCSEACYEWGESLGHPEPVFQERAASSEVQPGLF